MPAATLHNHAPVANQRDAVFAVHLGSFMEDGGASISSANQAVVAIDKIEHLRRLAAVAAVDALHQIHESRCYDDHGHANARTMFEHVAEVSGTESHRLDKIRRMVAQADIIATAWRTAELSVDKAALLSRAFANPRTRLQFLDAQEWLVNQARRLGVRQLTRVVARWIDVHDEDGPEPAPDPSFTRRSARLSQDHFAKTWLLDAELGSLQGSEFNQTFQAYVDAEFNRDWSAAEAVHGADTCRDLLARTDAQRRADALCQIAADAVNSDKPSAPVNRVHNIVWSAEAYEELLRRWAGAPAKPLDPGVHHVNDIDGNAVSVGAAFADSLVSSLRRVVQNAAGVTINLGTTARLFTGLARLGVMLSATECYWPGCHVPTGRCQIDHLRPATRSGPTDQVNGLPACQRHNRLKERGYTVTRAADGTISILTPGGDTIR